MVNGLYSVEFRGIHQGIGGLVELKDGTIRGSDAAYEWSGTYTLEGEKLQGKLFASSENKAINIFGNTEALELAIQGTIQSEGTIEVDGDLRVSGSPKMQAILTPVR